MKAFLLCSVMGYSLHFFSTFLLSRRAWHRNAVCTQPGMLLCLFLYDSIYIYNIYQPENRLLFTKELHKRLKCHEQKHIFDVILGRLICNLLIGFPSCRLKRNEGHWLASAERGTDLGSEWLFTLDTVPVTLYVVLNNRHNETFHDYSTWGNLLTPLPENMWFKTIFNGTPDPTLLKYKSPLPKLYSGFRRFDKAKTMLQS